MKKLIEEYMNNVCSKYLLVRILGEFCGCIFIGEGVIVVFVF